MADCRQPDVPSHSCGPHSSLRPGYHNETRARRLYGHPPRPRCDVTILTASTWAALSSATEFTQPRCGFQFCDHEVTYWLQFRYIPYQCVCNFPFHKKKPLLRSCYILVITTLRGLTVSGKLNPPCFLNAVMICYVFVTISLPFVTASKKQGGFNLPDSVSPCNVVITRM